MFRPHTESWPFLRCFSKYALIHPLRVISKKTIPKPAKYQVNGTPPPLPAPEADALLQARLVAALRWKVMMDTASVSTMTARHCAPDSRRPKTIQQNTAVVKVFSCAIIAKTVASTSSMALKESVFMSKYVRAGTAMGRLVLRMRPHVSKRSASGPRCTSLRCVFTKASGDSTSTADTTNLSASAAKSTAEVDTSSRRTPREYRRSKV
mmetsp:Transcript_48937/g.113791  ORF Transcript_48937/g.113791 Transcript_48937/m.113791 type:complete len:208 (+) Transcript_48937:637-1260(+)